MADIVGRNPRTGKMLRILAKDGLVAHIEETSGTSDYFLSAGFVDLQVNGFAGFDVNAPNVSIDTIIGLTRELLSRGVTCFAPTVITAEESRICHALETIAEARQRSPLAAACIPYVHVEGPHISPREGYRGAHPIEAVRPPSIAEFERWQGVSGGLVGLVTLSPHQPEAIDYITYLVRRGVHVALGHTHATPEQIRHAVDAGAKLSTHLGNAIPGEIPRHHNVIWTQLADDRLTATVIGDGHHLPADVLQVMLRAKGMQRILLVSDLVAVAGMSPGVYQTPVGGKVELRNDGKLCIYGADLLAGSTHTLAECIGTMVQLAGLPLEDALAMATINPGRFAGGQGVLVEGGYADAVRFRWDSRVEIEDVWLRGERVFARQA